VHLLQSRTAGIPNDLLQPPALFDLHRSQALWELKLSPASEDWYFQKKVPVKAELDEFVLICARILTRTANSFA
jgi:hypothetical protein